MTFWYFSPNHNLTYNIILLSLCLIYSINKYEEKSHFHNQSNFWHI